jgi:hypothetical protein
LNQCFQASGQLHLQRDVAHAVEKENLVTLHGLFIWTQ